MNVLGVSVVCACVVLDVSDQGLNKNMEMYLRFVTMKWKYSVDCCVDKDEGLTSNMQLCIWRERERGQRSE